MKTLIKKTFYNPHPGLLGCPLPLPEAIVQAAAHIDGKTETIDVVLDVLCAAVDRSDSEWRRAELKVHYGEGLDFIILEVERKCDRDSVSHGWRVICFKDQ